MPASGVPLRINLAPWGARSYSANWQHSSSKVLFRELFHGRRLFQSIVYTANQLWHSGGHPRSRATHQWHTSDLIITNSNAKRLLECQSESLPMGRLLGSQRDFICPITGLWPCGFPVIRRPESMTSARSVPADLAVPIRSGCLPVNRQSTNLVCIPEHKRVQPGEAGRRPQTTKNKITSF
jgi:hypothetical protein